MELSALQPDDRGVLHPDGAARQALWTPEQTAAFLDTAGAHRLFAVFYLALSTGMRRGELLALRWSDIKGSVIHVKQSLNYVKGEFILSTPKSKKGQRRIAVQDDVLGVLKDHKRRQQAERAQLGALWPESDLIFTSEVGTPLHPDNLTRLRGDLMDAAGVPRVRLHDLRHLHASICIRLGMNSNRLAERLGHSRSSFTSDTYVHLFEDQREEAVMSILDYLPRAGGASN